MFLLVTACEDSSNSKDSSIELTISAAASMMNVLTEIKEEFEEENPHIKVTFHFGGTGSLRKQVEQGAPIDVFFSASKKDYDLLVKGEYIELGEELLHNQIVAIQQKDMGASSLKDFAKTDQKLVIGMPESVPAGFYAKEVLQNMDLWDEFQGRTVFAKDVSHILQLVKDKAVAVGMVYGSDLQGVDELDLLEEIDASLHTPISYYVAVIENGNGRTSENQAAARQFYHYVQNKTSKKLFEQYGFVISDKLVNN